MLKKVYGEIVSDIRLSPRHTLRAWFSGHICRDYRMFGFEDRKPPASYMTTPQMLRTGRPNRRYSGLGKSKLSFYHLLKRYEIPQCEVLGLIDNHRYHTLSDGGSVTLSEFVANFLPDGKCFIKPDHGNSGIGCFLLERRQDKLLFNDQEKSMEDGLASLGSLRNCIATRVLEQDTYGQNLFAGTVNSIRLLTLMDPDSNTPFIGGAIQKIGRPASWPVDNFLGGKGCVSASIDVERGILGAGAMVDENARVHWCDTHPDNGQPIRGVAIPEWDVIKAQFLGYANRLSFLPLIAWDLVPWSTGGVVIEGNLGTGNDLYQLHSPMMEDQRARRFYEYHRVV